MRIVTTRTSLNKATKPSPIATSDHLYLNYTEISIMLYHQAGKPSFFFAKQPHNGFFFSEGCYRLFSINFYIENRK